MNPPRDEALNPQNLPQLQREIGSQLLTTVHFNKIWLGYLKLISGLILVLQIYQFLKVFIAATNGTSINDYGSNTVIHHGILAFGSLNFENLNQILKATSYNIQNVCLAIAVLLTISKGPNLLTDKLCKRAMSAIVLSLLVIATILFDLPTNAEHRDAIKLLETSSQETTPNSYYVIPGTKFGVFIPRGEDFPTCLIYSILIFGAVCFMVVHTRRILKAVEAVNRLITKSGVSESKKVK